MRTEQVAETAKMTRYYRGEYSALTGRKIVDVRAMYPEEMEALMWYGQPGAVLTLENGTMFIPMSDAEGNGAGALMVDEGE